ncbi:MAG: DUF2628 domain-containing protein [Oscillospiraceae bacterium]|nr:DUF2628 domain-containing protein [Oscillospiraceae bacterium]
MRYENEPCTACGQALQPETDDIVVCPECGAPLHRHCWKETGACPCADKHGADFVWVPTIAPPEPELPAQEGRPGAICPNCGENCLPDALRCDYCGADFEEFGTAMRLRFEQEQLRREQYMRENFPVYTVNGRNMTMGDTLAGQPVEEIALQLRGPRRAVSRYLERFEKDARLSWNWAAFLLGPYWYFFRKLYKPALLLAAALVALALGFSQVSGVVGDRFVLLVDQVQAADNDMSTQEAIIGYSRDMGGYFQSYRWQILTCAGIFIALRVASGLLADPLLRRKIWENIEYAHEEGATADGPGQRFGRHQLLIRLGGFSLVTPVLCYWALQLLPGMILEAIKLLVK